MAFRLELLYDSRATNKYIDNYTLNSDFGSVVLSY